MEIVGGNFSSSSSFFLGKAGECVSARDDDDDDGDDKKGVTRTKHGFSFPTTNYGMQNEKLSRNMYSLHAHFCTSGVDLYAHSVLVNKVSASELSRKFIEGWLLVGYLVVRLYTRTALHTNLLMHFVKCMNMKKRGKKCIN